MSNNAEVEDLRAAYDAWHDKFDVDKEADAPWHQLAREHLSVPSDIDGKTILEIGCGRGGFTCWLAATPKPPLQIVAVDCAAAAIGKAKAFAERNHLSRISWEIGDVQAVAHLHGTFDTVICCETIEHVPDPRKALAELARVLRRGGKLLLTASNYLGTLGLYRMYLRIRRRKFTEVGQPINNLTLLPLTRRWVERAGLHVTAVDGIGHYLPVPGRPPIRLVSLDNPRKVMCWFGLHSLITATKP